MGMLSISSDARGSGACNATDGWHRGTARLWGLWHILGTSRGSSPWAGGGSMGGAGAGSGSAASGQGFAVSRSPRRHFTLEMFRFDISQREISDFFLSRDGIFLLEPIYQNRNKSPATGSQNIFLASSDALWARSKRRLPPAPRCCCCLAPISLSVAPGPCGSWSLWLLVLVARGPQVLLATAPCHLDGSRLQPHCPRQGRSEANVEPSVAAQITEGKSTSCASTGTILLA